MIDKLNEIEARVNTLLEQLQGARAKIAELTKANGELQSQLASQGNQADENRTLREKIQALDSEIGSFGEREGEIRGRLQTILERISTLESEVQDPGDAPQ
jgi:chromosome segregation ATPase